MNHCAHVWPDELTPESPCEAGCGLEYGDWSEEDEPDE